MSDVLFSVCSAAHRWSGENKSIKTALNPSLNRFTSKGEMELSQELNLYKRHLKECFRYRALTVSGLKV